MKLSKTNYLIWRDCPHNSWLKVHRPDIYNTEPMSAFDEGLTATGNEVDDLARSLFPNGHSISRGDATTTTRMVSEHAPVLYQPVFETEQLTTACDILVWNEPTKTYDLYEVKASTSGGNTKAKQELYVHDIAFQVIVLAKNNVPLGRLFLVRLDSEYQRNETLDVDVLFTREDFTDEVADIIDVVREKITIADEWLKRATEPKGPCACITKGRSSHCTTFAHTNSNVPAYSVHDITRIGLSKKKLEGFVDAGILDIQDVPDDAPLSDIQAGQIRAAKYGRIKTDPSVIEDFLNALTYPLAFIDYETYPSAIPRFAGYHPFDQIPFQFSLDIITEPGGEIEHHEFLATDQDCPDPAFIATMRDTLPESGSIIVWNKTFEMGINTKLGKRNPDDAAFLQDINARVVDLADVFTSQAYVHPNFKGRTSIKAVLPVMVPELSYKTLTIQEGGSASEAWNEMVSKDLEPEIAEQIERDLLVYCGLDTRAMAEIWRAMRDLISR